MEVNNLIKSDPSLEKSENAGLKEEIKKLYNELNSN